MKRKKKLGNSAQTPARRTPWPENPAVQASALVLLVFLAYWNSLGGGFHFDDQGIFLDSYTMSPGFGWGILRLMQTRPLTFLSFHWNFLAGGGDPQGYHVVNVLLHAANSVLVMLVARRKLSGSLSWFAGALFALHPLQTQAVNYVFERATLLAAFFALLSLVFFLHDRYTPSAVAFGLSLLAKEETIALPAFLLAYDVVRRRDRIRWGYYAAMVGLGALATARLFYVLHATRAVGLGFGTKGVSPLSYALTQCRVIWIYLRLFLFPAGLNLDHDIPFSQNLFSPITTSPALLLLALLIGALAWLAWRENAASFWAIGFFVLLAPSSSVVPVVDAMFEHRTYFPLVCLTIAAACLLEPLRRPWLAPALAALLAALFVGTVVRNRVWRDDQSLWADVVQKSPGKARGYFQLGQVHASRDPARARQLYQHGLEIEPESSVGHTNLGLVLLSQRDPDAALDHLRKALVQDGENPTVWNNIGAAHLRRGEIEDGITSFRRALKSDPCRFDARVNLIRALSSLGENDNALRAGQVPADCHLLPGQVQRLEQELHSVR